MVYPTKHIMTREGAICIQISLMWKKPIKNKAVLRSAHDMSSRISQFNNMSSNFFVWSRYVLTIPPCGNNLRVCHLACFAEILLVVLIFRRYSGIRWLFPFRTRWSLWCLLYSCKFDVKQYDEKTASLFVFSGSCLPSRLCTVLQETGMVWYTASTISEICIYLKFSL
jgi:hypothetical protein